MADDVYRPLIAGIDTLEIGYCVDFYKLSYDEWDSIAQAKERAQATLNEKGMVITFRGINFEVQRTGSSRYKYILNNDDIQIKIFLDARAGTDFPELRIVFRSAFLWRKGWKEAIKIVDDWVSNWAVVVEVKISRIDLTVDFEGKLPIFTTALREVVTRGRKKTEYGTYTRNTDGKQSSGYDFGYGEIKCRIYDKTKEIIRSNKKWFETLWEKNGWEKGKTVTRVEFQCRRKIIRELQVYTIDDLFIQVADIWRYLTQEWLTVRKIGDDSHRTRWPIAEFWQIVQDAISHFGKITGVTRFKQLKPRYQRVERQARGLVASMTALAAISLGENKYTYGKRVVRDKIRNWLTDPDFEAEVEKRIKKYGVMKY